MSAPFASLTFALLVLVSGQEGASPDAPAAAEAQERDVPVPTSELRVLVGHAELATPDGVKTFLSTSPPVSFPGSGHIELGVHSEVSVRWSALSSVSVRGKASFGVDTDPDAPLDPRLSILFLRSAEIELRRGSLAVDLPQGWSLRLGRAVLSVVERPEGRLELVHRGGQPIEIMDRLGPDAKRSAPKSLRSGQRVLLDTAPYRARR